MSTPRAILVDTSDELRARGEALESPDLVETIDPRRKAGKVISQTFKFQIEGTEEGDVWTQTVRAFKVPTSRVRLVSRLNVTCVCDCPAWKWNGSDHWALENGYIYGLPKSNRSFPRIRDPEHKHPVCKHVVAAFKLIQETGLKVAS